MEWLERPQQQLLLVALFNRAFSPGAIPADTKLCRCQPNSKGSSSHILQRSTRKDMSRPPFERRVCQPHMLGPAVNL